MLIIHLISALRLFSYYNALFFVSSIILCRIIFMELVKLNGSNRVTMRKDSYT